MRVEVPQLRVGDEWVIGFSKYALTVDIEELAAGLAPVTVNDAGEDLIFVAEVGGGWLPDEVHTHVLGLEQILLETLIDLREELRVIAKLSIDARVG